MWFKKIRKQRNLNIEEHKRLKIIITMAANYTRTQEQCGDIIEMSQASDDGCINIRNMLSIEEVK